jgi:hypothetical protein
MHAAQHLIDRIGRAANGVHDRAPGAGAHQRIPIERDHALFWRRFLDGREIACGMNPRDRPGFTPGRIVAHEPVEARIRHRGLYRPQPVRTFRMARPRVMFEALRMREE